MSTEKEPSKQAQRIRYSKVGCKGGIMAEGAHLNRPAQGHTPGPWRVQRVHEKATGFRSVQIVSAGGLNIANVVMQLDDREQANERLIAAAPDLLAACLVALDRLNRLDDAGTGDHSPAYYQIQNAVIKAGRPKPQ